MKWAWIIALLGGGIILVGQGVHAQVGPFEGASAPQPAGRIDELVWAHLEERGIEPARLCSDAVFLRRVYLDLIGTLPTLNEARDFLNDRAEDKRRRLVETLLEREEYADYWAMKWCDLLRVKAEFPINLWPNAVQAYHRWIRDGLEQNLGYDQFVRQLLTSNGSNFRVPPVNFYRAVPSNDPKTLAQAVALTFMGVRAEKWPPEQLEGMAAFFTRIGFKSTGEWKEEIVFFDPGLTNAPDAGRLPDGSVVRLLPEQDPRQVLADWLIRPENPWFARNFVNRVWSWLLGRGIIHEPDDIRPDNPPSHPGLLAYLEKEFIAHDYDPKHLFRLILNSTTYQLSSIPASQDAESAACFASYPVRRLEAEVLIDGLCQITGTTEKYSSPIPEPFTFIPEDQRSIALADGSITSSFLELFGRPSRDTGLESERNNQITPAQRLHLLNSSHVQRKLEQTRKFPMLQQGKRTPRQFVTGIYLAVLSRFPTDRELEIAGDYLGTGGTRSNEAALDLMWALINSPEFLYRH